MNDNGVADEDELIEGAVSNDKGEVLLEGESLTYNLIIDGGVNTDTGAKNELALKAPKGFAVINLVQKIYRAADTLMNPAIKLTKQSQISANRFGFNINFETR